MIEFDQLVDVFEALAQRRHAHLDDVDAIEQVLAEFAVGHQRREILVSRREDAHVDRDFLAISPTGRTVFSWITRNSFTCMCSGRSAISSRNSVPPSADWIRPCLSATAPVKLPFLWPNSSLSISSVGIAPQFTGHERPVAARAGVMDQVRHQLLAGAGLAIDCTGAWLRATRSIISRSCSIAARAAQQLDLRQLQRALAGTRRA